MSGDTTAEDTGRPPEEAAEMEHITLRLPAHLLDEVNDVWAERGFANRSEFLRTAVRDAVYPPTTLSAETLETIEESIQQFEDDDVVDLD